MAVAIISSLVPRVPTRVETATIAPSAMSRFSSCNVIPNRSAAVMSGRLGRRIVAVAERVRIQRLQRERLRGHIVVLRIPERLFVQLLRLGVVVRLVRKMAGDDVGLV